MLSNPLFWLYFTILFAVSSLIRVFLWITRRKRRGCCLVYAVLSLASLSVFWLVMDTLSFSNPQNLIIYLLSAILPGVVSGLFPPLLILVPGAMAVLSFILGISVANLGSSSEQVLGQLSFYPAPEGTLYFEWSTQTNLFAASVEGDKLAVVLEYQILPEYLYFLETKKRAIGFTSENKGVPELLSTDSESFLEYKIDPEINEKAQKFIRNTYPALKFQEPGFFDSFTYKITNSGELTIIERKTLPR